MDTPELPPNDPPRIREELLCDPKLQLHQIAPILRAYLTTIRDSFHPKAVVLFGSWARNQASPQSDLDLLLIQDYSGNAVEAASKVRAALRPVRRRVGSLPCDILIESPETHRDRIRKPGAFYREIWGQGLRLL